MSGDVLRNRPLTPTNVDLFAPGAYPDAPPLAPAAGPPPTTGQVRGMLRDYLAAEFPSAPQRRAEGMAIFDDPDLIARVPNPSLRAAIVGLMGTAGEPAIDFIVNAKTATGLPKVQAIGFDSLPWDPSDNHIARPLLDTNGQLAYVFNPAYSSENPFQFSRIMAHEPAHTEDLQASDLEEVIIQALESHIYLEQLVRHPELASADGELARRANTNALARLNSGTDGELGLFATDGDEPILPGSPVTATSWWGQFEDLPNLIDTPGNAILRAYLANMAEPGSVVPRHPTFSMQTLRFIDRNSDRLAEELQTKKGLGVFDALGLANVDEGNAGRDRLIGTVITDHLRGLAGNDLLSGNDGDDQLDGGAGNDSLTGGLGRDALTGGAGADTFRFLSAADSAAGRSRDAITDFGRTDTVDLTAIDANSGRGRNQAFTFIDGDAFGDVAGELRFKRGVLSGDVNGDGRADFEIALVRVSSLDAADILL